MKTTTRRMATLALPALLLAGCQTAMTPPVASAPVETAAFQPAPVSQLVDAVDIDYDTFTLPNGLTVVVHEDRKAPVVAVSVWYDVGSKHEPAGKTGFAHLFEHLMFNGSENAPGDFFEPLQQVGATDFNGTTNPDRTNYFETVPTGALERALMLESDRMGYLLGAVTQEKLDNQIGVVQNEKRQGDNQPYGLLRYEIFENLFPTGHRYHHSTIGSMADLEAASLEDVKNWFRDNYGPNNAVLVLAGDIDAAEARPLVAKWFGAIPRGPAVDHPEITIPTLAEPKEVVTTDQIATTRIYRMWTTPGMASEDSNLLALGASVLGGLSSSRLDNAMVRAENPLAVAVSSYLYQLEDAGIFIVQADARPGVDAADLAAKLDAEVASYLATGPSAAELERAKTSTVAGTIRGLESVGGFGGKAPVLAQGELYMDNPGFFEEELGRLAEATPAGVTAAMTRWLSRPVFSLVMNPGERTAGGEERGGAVIERDLSQLGTEYACGQAQCDLDTLVTLAQDRSQLPAVGQLADLDFPDIETATLSNGQTVYFARRDAVPTVSVRLGFDAGYAADPRGSLGLTAMMLAAMDEGTTSLDAIELAEAQERLGANLSGFADLDSTYFQLSALEPNLAPSLELFADFVRNPAFADAEVERVRTQQLTRINSELNNPSAIAARALAPLIYGADHPYGIPPSGLGNVDVVEGLSPADLRNFHDSWLRPDRANIYVVGDTTLAEIVPLLERSFGDWRAPAATGPAKNFDAAIPAPRQRIVLIDRPNSPQSVITAARVLDLKGTDDLIGVRGANEVFGGSFLSRINMNLRETKGWSYGVRSGISGNRDRVAFTISAPVQADRTGDSIAELRKDLTSFTGDSGVSAAELERFVNGNVRELPGSFETSADVLSGMTTIVELGRPFDYYETLADRYRGFTAADLDSLARGNFLGGDLVYVVVGDADVVRPQLDALGIPVELAASTND